MFLDLSGITSNRALLKAKRTIAQELDKLNAGIGNVGIDSPLEGVIVSLVDQPVQHHSEVIEDRILHIEVGFDPNSVPARNDRVGMRTLAMERLLFSMEHSVLIGNLRESFKDAVRNALQ